MTTSHPLQFLFSFDNTYVGLVGVGIVVSFFAWFLKPCKWTPPFIPKSPLIDVKVCQEKWSKCQSPPTGDAYLVIGVGFLGSHILEVLLQRGETNVTVFDFDANVKWASDNRVKFIHGDIRSADQVHKSCKGKKAVYMTAATIRFMDDLDFQWKRSYDVNVVGTQNVVDACIENEVQYLIQTSTMMVNIPKTHDNSCRLTEDMPYVTKENATSHYATIKAMGEKIVRDANGKNGILKTISLRPGGIFGANDGTMIEIMMRQNMYIFLANFLVDFVFVENVVYAHLLGEVRLRSPSDSGGVSGEAFNVSNEEPMRNNPFRRMILHYANIHNAFHGPSRLFLFWHM